MPVPWIASWSSEMPNFRVQKEPLIAGSPPALFRGSGKRGEGTPVLGKMDVGRQRYCVLKGVCQICAKPLLPHEMWLALLVDRVEHEGRSLPFVREPASCTACMVMSLETCPALRRASPSIIDPAETMILMTKTIPPIGGFGTLTPDGLELVNPDPKASVIGYLKIVVKTAFRQLSPDDFIAKFKAP